METMTSADSIGKMLSQSIQEEENNRRLSPEVMEILRESGYHHLYVPASLGGKEMDPVSAARLVEEVAGYNTAAGWSMMVANVSTWWCSRLSNEGVETVYDGKTIPLIAGAFHPPMAATRAKGGFIINGRSPLASNVSESDWIFVTALEMENGNVVMENGFPHVIGVHLKTEDCEILDTWHTIGMKATDSNDIAVKDLFVPNRLVYPLTQQFNPNKHFTGALYRFPAIGASIASLIAPIALAVARNAISELKQIALKKTSFGSVTGLRERGVVQRKLGMAEAMVESSRAYLYHSLEKYWKMNLEGSALTLEDKAHLLLAATHTNQSCCQAVDLMYSAGGTTGIYNRNKLSRYFTDMQVIRQHGFANDSRYETAAQVFFGLTPDLPVLSF
jgi:indole-3-acetate monooxygenase